MWGLPRPTIPRHRALPQALRRVPSIAAQLWRRRRQVHFKPRPERCVSWRRSSPCLGAVPDATESWAEPNPSNADSVSSGKPPPRHVESGLDLPHLLGRWKFEVQLWCGRRQGWVRSTPISPVPGAVPGATESLAEPESPSAEEQPLRERVRRWTPVGSSRGAGV